MAKKNLVTGIDIGSSSVKVVTLAWSEKGGIELRKATRADIDTPSEDSSGQELRRLQADALAKAFADHKSSRATVVASVARDAAVLRYLTLPSVKQEELKEMLGYDVERHVPFDSEQIETDFQVLHRRGDSESEILLAAVPNQEMNELLEILSGAGVDPDIIDVSILGACQAYMNGNPRGQVRAVLNLGCRASEIGLFQDGVVRFSRSLPVGLNRLNAMMAEAGLPTHETYPNFDRLGGPDGKIREDWLRQLVAELSRSIQAFRHEKHTPPPETLILCGGLADAPGLARRLSVDLGIHAETLPPLLPDKVVRALPAPEAAPEAAPEPAGTTDLDDFTAVSRKPRERAPKRPSVAVSPMPEYATAIGLALRAARRPPLLLNLLPERIIHRREVAHQNRFVRGVATLLALILLEVGAVVGMSIWDRHQQIARLERDIALLKPQVAEIAEANDQLAKIAGYRDAENSFYRILHDLHRLSPEGVQLTFISFTKQKELVLRGHVFTNRDANLLREYINESGYFNNVVLTMTKEVPPGVRTVDPNMKIVAFDMKCDIRSARRSSTSRGGR